MGKKPKSNDEANKVRDLAPKAEEVKGGRRADFNGTYINEIKLPPSGDKGY